MPYGAVRQLNMAPPQMRVAWTTKSIDSAIVWDPVFDALRGMGGQVIKTDADLPPDASSYNVCIANTNWVKAHPKIAVGFVKALDQGVAYTRKNPQQALAIMAKAAGISEAVAKTELAGYEVYSGAGADDAESARLGRRLGQLQHHEDAGEYGEGADADRPHHQHAEKLR